LFQQAQVDTLHDFLELGGDSIAAARIRVRMDRGLGIDLSVRDLLDAATVRRVEEVVRAKSDVGSSGAS